MYAAARRLSRLSAKQSGSIARLSGARLHVGEVVFSNEELR